MSSVFTVWCDTDEEAGPDLQRSPGGASLLDPDAWSAWLIEHQYHDLSLVLESTAPFGLPAFQASRGGIRFQLRTQDEVDALKAWAEYRKAAGTSASKEDRVHERAAFLAGWAAVRHDAGGGQR